MYQNYQPYYQQQQVAPKPMAMPQANMGQMPSAFLKGRPVSSLDEVRATSVDFDGSVFFFPDLANRCIYTKQINMDGTATLNMYELKEIPLNPMPQPANNYVTREEFDATLKEIKAMLAPKEQSKKEEHKF